MDDAVDGRLPALGGCGNDAMLIVRRRDFSGLPGGRPPEDDRPALRLEVELELESGDLSDGLGLEGVRNLEAPYGEAALGVSGAAFRGFGLERGGSDPEGELPGRAGCGSVEVEAMAKFFLDFVSHAVEMGADGFSRQWMPCGRIGGECRGLTFPKLAKRTET
jgi:hypothetical protein